MPLCSEYFIENALITYNNYKLAFIHIANEYWISYWKQKEAPMCDNDG